jgi:2-polyprenyl-3-methyl-5-hydroxy-6-metoxy-1,4-benzoquinol methylase
MTLRDAWQAHAQDWLAWTRRPGHDGFWQLIQPPLLDLLPPPGRLTVDVGCGEGRFSRELQRRGHRVVGIDVAAVLVQAAHAAGTPAV